jgi:hypothetical protein
MEKTAEKKEEIVKIVFGSFLRDEIVSVKPVPSKGKWAGLLVAGQDKKTDPFIYNKVKRSYAVPLKPYLQGGGVVSILDDMVRVHIKKYIVTHPDGMTQKEFFEKELRVDMNTMLPVTENFWRTNKQSRVTLTREGLTLNLNEPLDMLKYLVLLSNKMLISPSFDDVALKATYEFMIVNEGKVTAARVNDAEIKGKAYGLYARITDDAESMKDFIKSLGRVLPAKANLPVLAKDTIDWMKTEILNVLEKNAEEFINIVNSPHYKQKIFIQNATEVGVILRKSDKRYTLDDGTELGDLSDVINFLSDSKNEELRLRIKSKIQLAKGK